MMLVALGASATFGVVCLLYAVKAKSFFVREIVNALQHGHHRGKSVCDDAIPELAVTGLEMRAVQDYPAKEGKDGLAKGGSPTTVDECDSVPSTAASSHAWSMYKGHTVHINEDVVIWPNGDRSELQLHRADSWCRTDGLKLYWPDEAWSYIGEDTLDGMWRTNSGQLLQIAGNLVTWMTGERAWLTMESCNEMSVEVMGQMRRAIRLDSQLHWDDGDEWTLHNDQKVPVQFEKLHTGTIVRVASWDSMYKEQVGLHMNLVGKSVICLAKRRADSCSTEDVAVCLAPDGQTTLQLPMHALTALPSAPPPVLQARGCDALAGDYQLSIETSPAGMPTWRHVSNDVWVYTSSEGRWCFGTADDKAAASSVGPEVVSRDQHWGLMPHQLTRGWRLRGNSCKSQFGQGSEIEVVSVLRRSNGDGLAMTIRAMPIEVSQEVNLHVWKGWAGAISINDCAEEGFPDAEDAVEGLKPSEPDLSPCQSKVCRLGAWRHSPTRTDIVEQP